MFINILQLNRKRHHTLTILKDSKKICERSFKSIQNLKISAIDTSKPHHQTQCKSKQKQRVRGSSYQAHPKGRQSAPIKIFQKVNPLKLQITPQINKITQSTFHSSFQNESSNDVKKLIQAQMMQLIIENRLASQYNPAFCVFRKEDISKLLHKVCLAFQENDPAEEELTFLNATLKEIKNITIRANRTTKANQNRFKSSVFSISEFKTYSESLQNQKTELQEIYNQKMQILEEYKILEEKKNSIQQHNMWKLKQIQKQNAQINANLQAIIDGENKLADLKQEIQVQESMLQAFTSETNHILHFVQTQSKNKLVQLASEQYKLIESEIYEYAVYLQANELANSLAYESLPMKYFNSLINSLDSQLKVVNKNIMQNDEMTLEDKAKSMRDFVLKMHEAYQKKSVEQQKALEFKTKCIIKFVDMMKKWLDNWTLKQEYLVSLRKQFAADSITYQKSQAAMKTYISNAQLNRIQKEFQLSNGLYAKLKENYLMGNSFY